MNNSDTSKDINFVYLIISIIILFISYAALLNVKENIVIKKTAKPYILLQTDSDIIKIKPDIFDIHLQHLKDKLFVLNNNFDKANCPRIKKYLEDSHYDLQKFILENGGEVDEASEIDLISRNLLNNKGLVHTQLNKVNPNHNRIILLNIIRDIEMLSFLIRDSTCPNGKLELINLHKLIEELYKNNCIKISNKYPKINNISTFTGEFTDLDEINQKQINQDDNNYREIPSIRPNKGYINRSSLSQNCAYSTKYMDEDKRRNVEFHTVLVGSGDYVNDNENLMGYKANTINMRDMNYIPTLGQNLSRYESAEISDYTVLGNSSSVFNRKFVQPETYKPICDINNEKFERKKKQALLTDQNFNRSLCSDYDYLDA